MIKCVRPFLNMVSKAKAAKLVRALVDLFLDMEAGTGSEVSRDGLPPDFSGIPDFFSTFVEKKTEPGKLTIFLLGEKMAV